MFCNGFSEIWNNTVLLTGPNGFHGNGQRVRCSSGGCQVADPDLEVSSGKWGGSTSDLATIGRIFQSPIPSYHGLTLSHVQVERVCTQVTGTQGGSFLVFSNSPHFSVFHSSIKSSLWVISLLLLQTPVVLEDSMHTHLVSLLFSWQEHGRCVDQYRLWEHLPCCVCF